MPAAPPHKNHRWLVSLAALALLCQGCTAHLSRAPAAAKAAAEVKSSAIESPPPLAELPTATDWQAALAAAWPSRNEVEPLARATKALEQLVVLLPAEPVYAAQLAHAYFLHATYHLSLPADRQERLRLLMRGIVVAEMGLRTGSPALTEKLAEGVAFEAATSVLGRPALPLLVALCECMGAFAASRGATAALFYAERLKASIERMVELDPSYALATPERFLAIWLARMPGLVGGSARDAENHFRRATMLAPRSAANVLAWLQYGQPVPKSRRELLSRLATLAEEANVAAGSGLPGPQPRSLDERRGSRGQAAGGPSSEETISGPPEERLSCEQARAWLRRQQDFELPACGATPLPR